MLLSGFAAGIVCMDSSLIICLFFDTLKQHLHHLNVNILCLRVAGRPASQPIIVLVAHPQSMTFLMGQQLIILLFIARELSSMLLV